MIKIIDLKREYRSIAKEINEAVLKVLERGWFVLGEEVEGLEKEFANYIGTKYAVGVNSGSDALYLALQALNIGVNDEVITVSHTFISTVDAIVRNGATPIFIDVDPNTYTIDVNEIEKKISSKTKAILPVHLYGHPADMDTIIKVAQKYNLFVVEDACQAHGSEYKGQKVGGIGDIGCFSFYPAKNLGAYGDGGIIVTNNEGLYNKLKRLRNYGSSKKYYHDFIGINSRLDELQAAILRIKLKYLDIWNDQRRKIAQFYTESLKDKDIVLPLENKDVKHVYHMYVVRTHQRDKLQKYLLDNGVQTQIHYPIPVHKQNAYIDYRYKLPTTEEICKQILSLPISPWLDREEQIKIINLLKKYYG